MHDGDVAVQHGGELLRRLRTAHVRRHHAQLLGVEAHGPVVVHEDGHGRHMVHRLIEEALDGVLVQVDSDDVVHARRGQKIGHELRGDRLARSRLAVLARIAVMGDHGRYGTCRGALRRVGHDEQLHERVVHVVALGAAHRLDEEHVGTADALLVARVDLAVRELLQLHVAERGVQVLRYLVGELGVDRPREQGHALLHFRHVRAPSCCRGAAAPAAAVAPSHMGTIVSAGRVPAQ